MFKKIELTALTASGRNKKNVMQSIINTIVVKCCQYDFQMQPLTVQITIPTVWQLLSWSE